MDDEKPEKFWEGFDYLRVAVEVENACQQHTSESLASMGQKAPKCFEALGTVLSFGERIASCFWNCPGGDYNNHVIQYITGRANSFGRASVRLALMGFYDESLSLARSLGEIANLFMLFAWDAAEMNDWKTTDAEGRHRRFRPAQIRNRIAAHGPNVPMSGDKYGLLCELATHPVPQLRPQSYNIDGKAMTGGVFQEAGFLAASNETAVLESWIVIIAAKLCDVPAENRQPIREACLECLKQAGGVDVQSLPAMWEKLRTGSGSS